jgi:phage regulator Rha-like protein
MNDMMKNLQRMTSLEIAQVTGKPHNDVLKAIRKMEQAWMKVNGGNFSLVDYKDSKGELRPCYTLTKTECLYVATKFNDAARARLVLRWEELEHARLTQPTADARALLVTEKEILSQGDRIRRQTIGRENAAADGCLTVSELARELATTVRDLNRLLVDRGVQFWNGGRYKLTAEYRDCGLAKDRAFHYYSLEGEKKQRYYLVWTREGADYIRSMF